MKTRKKLLACVLSLAMVSAYLPAGGSVAVNADETTENYMGLSTKNIDTDEKIYIGNYINPSGTKVPLIWFMTFDDVTRVNPNFRFSDGANDVDTAEALLLFSYYFFPNVHYRSTESPYAGQAWQQSNAQSWCQDFYNNCLADAEKNMILQVSDCDADAANEYSLINDKVFILNGKESFTFNANLSKTKPEYHRYGWDADSNTAGNKNTYVWGRGHSGGYQYIKVSGAASSTTRYYPDTVAHPETYLNARPAMNIKKSSIVFTADPTYYAGDFDGLTAMTAPELGTVTEHKVAVIDNTREFALSPLSTTQASETSLEISYSGAATGENEWISAIITDGTENNNIIYYGRLAQPTNTSGTVTVTLPEGCNWDNLYLFNEQVTEETNSIPISALKQVDFSLEDNPPVQNDPTYTVTIPADIAFSGSDPVYRKVSAEWNVGDKTLNVALSSENNFKLIADTDAEGVPYTVTCDNAELENNAIIISGTAENSDNKVLIFTLDLSQMYAGAYSDKLTFNISLT